MLQRKPIKYKPGSLKKSGKIKTKKKSLEQIEEKKKEREKDWSFYLSIWEERPHRCEVSGVPLGSELKTIFCDHLIEKSTHPELRYVKENIILVSGDIHQLKTNGFPHPLHKARIEKAKEELL